MKVNKLKEKYSFEENTFKKVKIQDGKRKIEIEIGDEKEPTKFIPQFKTKHWDNEANFSMRFLDDYDAGILEDDDEKVVWKGKEYTARMYEKDTDDEDGGFEFDIFLEKKPKNNVFDFSIQHKELDFFYQGELTDEEKKDGANRPENVIGSYAVYHKTKKHNFSNKHYRTGKAFHIYRPYAEDSNGVKEWCELNIDEKKGLLSVTVPKEYLNKASYPVVVDPTFGYTTAGSSSFAIGGEDFGVYSVFRGNVHDGVAGTLDSLHSNLFGNQTADVYMALFDRDSDAVDSHDKVVGIERTSLVVSASKTWYTFTASDEAITAQEYILTAIADGADVSFGQTIALSFDSVGNDGYYHKSGSYSTLIAEDPLSDTDSGGSSRYSLYATYSTNIQESRSADFFQMF